MISDIAQYIGLDLDSLVLFRPSHLNKLWVKKLLSQKMRGVLDSFLPKHDVSFAICQTTCLSTFGDAHICFVGE